MTSFKIRLLLITVLLAPLGLSAQTPIDNAINLLERGEYFAAERIVAPMVAVKKPDAVALWAMSRVRVGQGQTAEGIKLVERALKADDSQARFHAQLGAALIAHLGSADRIAGSAMLPRARKAYEKALSLDGNNLVALLGLSRLLWSLPTSNGGDIAKAKTFAERARQIDPFKGEMELGAIASARRDHAAALTHFEAAIALDPKDVNARVSCGHALMRLDRLREARERFEEALQIDRKSEAARLSLETVDAVRAKQAKR